VLLATLDRPHYDIALPDLSDGVVTRLTDCFDPPIPNPGETPARGIVKNGGKLTMDWDLWVDFQRMQDSGTLLARSHNARPGLTLVAGMYLVVGCEDAEPAVARVLAVTADGSVQLQVLEGPVDLHRNLLATSA
jgi:hypothetical protein